MLTKQVLMTLYERLYEAYGRQNWWPAETPFEVMVGAILTQNTAWTNVEKAINALKKNDSLALQAINRLDLEQLALLIRPAGYFNVKSRRLKHLCNWLVEQGGLQALTSRDTEELRNQLLSVNGIGPETADDILLYAFERPVFVIDAYTRRLLVKLGLIEGNEKYQLLRAYFETVLDPSPVLYNEYHALIVRHAKEKCVNSMACRHCRVESPIKTG